MKCLKNSMENMHTDVEGVKGEGACSSFCPLLAGLHFNQIMKGLSSHHQFMEKWTDIERNHLWKWMFITSRLTGLIYTSIKVIVSNSRFQINGMYSWFRSDHILPLYQSASFNSLQILNREKKNAHGCFKREYRSNWLANSTHIQMWYLFTPLNNWPLGIY